MNRPQQGRLAGSVEIGVGFVENDEARLPIKGAGERDALPLAAGKRVPAVADLRIVAIRQLLDEFMTAGQHRGLDDEIGVAVLEPRDVLRDRAGEQLHVLRQISDIAPKLLRIPMAEIIAVEAHRSAQNRPNADENAREARFSGGAGADDPDHLAGRDLAAYPL